MPPAAVLSAAEVSAASLVLEFAMNESNADSDRATALFGLFALGLRNGVATTEALGKFYVEGFAAILAPIYSSELTGRDSVVLAVAFHLMYLVSSRTMINGEKIILLLLHLSIHGTTRLRLLLARLKI
mgnify:CR=1 FL=1